MLVDKNFEKAQESIDAPLPVLSGKAPQQKSERVATRALKIALVGFVVPCITVTCAFLVPNISLIYEILNFCSPFTVILGLVGEGVALWLGFRNRAFIQARVAIVISGLLLGLSFLFVFALFALFVAIRPGW